MRFQHLKDPPIIHGKYKVIRHARFVDVLFLIAMRRTFPLLLSSFFPSFKFEETIRIWSSGRRVEGRIKNFDY